MSVFTLSFILFTGFLPLEAYAQNLCQAKEKPVFISSFFTKKVSVFKRDGSVQCPEEKCTSEKCKPNLVVLPKEMAKELKSHGVKVFKALQGTLPHRRALALCGSPTNNINIFYIPAKQKQKALDKGFKPCQK